MMVVVGLGETQHGPGGFHCSSRTILTFSRDTVRYQRLSQQSSYLAAFAATEMSVLADHGVERQWRHC